MLALYRAEFFQDGNQDWYYYRRQAKKLYKIPKKTVSLFQVYRQRLIVAIALGAVVYSFYPNNIWLSFFAGGLFYLLATTHFYKRLLPGLLEEKEITYEVVCERFPQQRVENPTKLLLVSAIGLLVIIASFFVASDVLNRVILMFFGLAVVTSATQQLR